MLNENKFSSYLIYAVGEIVLVVIGILLAIQINLWNQQRKIEKSNTVYILKILNELKLNKERIDFLAEKGWENDPSIKEAYENCDSLLFLTTRGLTGNDLDFILTARFDAGGSQWSLYDATYQELLNTGKLYTLGSDSLVNAIKSYYKRYERETKYKNRGADIAGYARVLMEKNYAKLKLDYELNPHEFDLANYPWYFEPNSTEYINFQIGLSRFRDTQYEDYGKSILLDRHTDFLIAVLEKELSDK
jgi:hypothetical protein